DIRGDLALMLDVAPKQTVEAVDASDVLELVEDDEGAESARCLETQRQVEQGVERGERVARRIELESRTDAEGAEREADPRALDERLHLPAQVAAEVLRVGPLEPDGHVRDRCHAVEVDEHADQAFAALAVVESACEEARLAVLARRVEPDVVAADGVTQEVGDLGVPVDDVPGRHRAREEQRVDVHDHASRRLPHMRHGDYRSVVPADAERQSLRATYQPISTS